MKSGNLFCLGLVTVLVWCLSVAGESGNGDDFMPGELLVKFRSPPGFKSVHGSVDSLNQRFRVESMEQIFEGAGDGKSGSKGSGLARIYRLRLPGDSDILSIARAYEADPLVEYAEPNYIHHTLTTPDDIYYPDQWAHQNMQSGDAWDTERGNSSIVIAIVDTGVVWNHSDLALNIWNNPGEIPDNGVDDDGNGFIDDVRGYDFVNLSNVSVCAAGEDCSEEDNDPMDFNGHGTHCAGIAGAVSNNSLGIAGLCWKCRIMPVRAGYSTASGGGKLALDDILQSIVYAADNGANVISMSFGSSSPSTVRQEAVDYAYSKGAVLVASAGNSDDDANHYPSSYSNVISVSATDVNDVKASFSCHGSMVDVAAPGVNILSTYTNEGREVKLFITSTGEELNANGMTYSVTTPPGGVTCELLHADLGYPGNFSSQNFTGKIALIKRGEMYFYEKVDNAYGAGAVGVVMYNSQPGSFGGTLLSLSEIPAVTVSQEDGLYLLDLLGNGSVTVNMSLTPWDYSCLDGTSMSTPYVAGLAGLILSRNPGSGQEEVRTILRSTTDNVSSDKYIGVGRVNAFKALQRNPCVIADLDSSLDYVAVGGLIDIVGTANGSCFQNYGVYFGEGVYPVNWSLIDSSTTPVSNSTLAVWDSSNLRTETYYSVRLVVADSGGFLSEDRFVSSTTHDCSNCSDCNGKIESASRGDRIYLSSNVSNQAGSCFVFNRVNDITLDCGRNRVSGNTSGYGTLFYIASGNTLRDCRFSLFGYGLYLYYSESNTVSGNIIDGNEVGVHTYSGEDVGLNLLYNNFFNNSVNYLVNGTNYTDYWNSSRETGDRIYSLGTEVGGNYWSSPSGTGYSNNCSDLDCDGFCDSPYELDALNIDYLPLSDEYGVCLLPGDYPPCGEVTLSEVVDYVNLWADDRASLAGVIDLINAWAGG